MKTFKELLAEARQFKDPKKDSLVTKAGKTIVIDKSKEKEYLKKGWTLSEDGLDEFGSSSMSAADKDNLRRNMKKKKESVKESSAAYADSLAKIAADKKLKGITSKDRETLVKLAALMSEEEFVPHKMYDADGKAHDVNTPEMHMKYKKMGYTEKPDTELKAYKH